MMTLTITLPMPANIANGQHQHYRVRSGMKRAYFAACDRLQLIGRIPAPPAAPIAKARLDSIMHLGAMMDQDNALRRHKWALDWLKTRGYLVDDSPTHLEWVSFPEQRVKRGQEYRLELTLTPLVIR